MTKKEVEKLLIPYKRKYKNDSIFNIFEQIIAKYERKLKKEYNRGFDAGVEAEAKVKKGTKRLCSECGKRLTS